MATAAVITQSLLALVQLSADMAVLLATVNAGEEVTDAEWAALKGKLDQATSDWENA